MKVFYPLLTKYNSCPLLYAYKIRSEPNKTELKQPRPRRQLNRPKSNWFYEQNNGSACASRFFSTFRSRPLHHYDLKPPNATFYGGREHTTKNVPFSFWTWIKSLRIQLQENCLHLTNWKVPNRHDEDWKNLNSFFEATFSLPPSWSLLMLHTQFVFVLIWPQFGYITITRQVNNI